MEDQLHKPASDDQTEDSSFSSNLTRRDLVKSGAAVTSGLVLSARYTKPSVSSLALQTTLDPSGTRTDGGQGKGKAKNKGKGKAKGKAQGSKK